MHYYNLKLQDHLGFRIGIFPDKGFPNPIHQDERIIYKGKSFLVSHIEHTIGKASNIVARELT